MTGQARRAISRDIFEPHIVRENGTRFRIEFLQHELDELDRIAEDEFRAKYDQEYRDACSDGESKWMAYRVGGVLDGQIIDCYEDSTRDEILNRRRREIRAQAEERYINGIISEVEKALERRAMSEPRYETEWGFRVKSKGEQIIANALRFYTFTSQSTGKCDRITLLYEPLFRIPDENRVIIPDFVIPEYCLVLEYAGLEGREYKFGLFMKTEAMKKLGFRCVVINPEDLTDPRKSLNEKLSFYFDFQVLQDRPF